MKNPDRYHVLLDVIFLGERSLTLGDLRVINRGVTRPLSFNGGEQGFCPAKLSGALQTSKQSFVYRMLIKALSMYNFLYQG